MADDNTLSADGEAFLRSLEEKDYPKTLATNYPRIINVIAEKREDREALKAYLDGLLADTRGGRKGFSLSVLMDVQNMRDLLVGPESEDPKSQWL
jgi:hypothetical protein